MINDKDKTLLEMLFVANHLRAKADDAYMEHDDVYMPPREVHGLANDIESWYNEFAQDED